MSKSKGNVIYADDLARLFGVDAVRFFVLHEMPFDNDGQISWELVAERYNSELANVLGNLVSRTVAMIVKYFGGAVEKGLAAEEAPDAEFKKTVAGVAAKVRAKADSLHIADAITEIFTLFRRANKYIDETMPWALAKDESKKARLNDVLYNLSEAIQIGASLLDSFMPETSAKILAAFNGRGRNLDECGRFGLSETVAVTPAPALFARIDFKALEPEIEKICEAQKAAASAEKPTGGMPLLPREVRARPRPIPLPHRLLQRSASLRRRRIGKRLPKFPSTILRRYGCRWGRSSPVKGCPSPPSCCTKR